MRETLPGYTAPWLAPPSGPPIWFAKRKDRLAIKVAAVATKLTFAKD